MTKNYQLTGPTDTNSREKLISELHDVPGVHDVEIVAGPDAENQFSIALSGWGFSDDKVDDAAGAAGYRLHLS